ncbi:MAG: creatininase family protein [Alphaproteobacteria bacterium]|nr:creatininase family protein [Alphaproteobacteria bacterium]
MMGEVEWANLKAHELRRLAEQDAVVLLPVAALEQHGPHLPVQVDTRLAGEISKRTAKRASADVPTITLPVVWHGLSEHHMVFGGTITVDYDTFHQVLRGIVGSVVRHGFKKILIVNGHGGNHVACQMSAQQLHLEFGVPVLALTYWHEAASRFAPLLEDQTGLQHACEAETSMMMALVPHLVDSENLAAAKGGEGGSFLQKGEAAFRWHNLAHVTANGTIGDPTKASAEKGERLLDAGAEALAELITNPDTWAPAKDLRPAETGGVAFRKA